MIPPFGGSIPPAPARQSALPRKPSPYPGRGRKQRALTHLPLVSTFPFGRFGRSNRQKSPAVFKNIPVFRRLRPETWFDRQVRAAVIWVYLPQLTVSCSWRHYPLSQRICPDTPHIENPISRTSSAATCLPREFPIFVRLRISFVGLAY